MSIELRYTLVLQLEHVRRVGSPRLEPEVLVDRVGAQVERQLAGFTLGLPATVVGERVLYSEYLIDEARLESGRHVEAGSI